MVRTTFLERENIRKLNQTVRRCNRNRRRPECHDLPSDENGKFYNPANPPQTTTPSTTITTTTTRTRPRSDVIDRGVIDRGVIVRPPNIVISREDPDESYRDQNYQNVSTKVFNPFTPVTEIQNRRTDPITTTQQPAVTLNGTFTLTPNQIANTAGPEILFPGDANVNGWILLVGILGGTIVLVTLVWNSMKLWCRKCERDACRQPPTITYLTPDQALSNSNNDSNRLAEVPVMAINTFHLETGANCLQSGNSGTETLLTNAELNRLMIANQNRQAGHGGGGVAPVLIQNQSPTMTQATTVTPDSEPPSYSQVISETSRENDNDTLNAGESIEESPEMAEETEETAAEAEIQREENDNDSISSADTVNSVQRVQSV